MTQLNMLLDMDFIKILIMTFSSSKKDFSGTLRYCSKSVFKTKLLNDMNNYCSCVL